MFFCFAVLCCGYTLNRTSSDIVNDGTVISATQDGYYYFTRLTIGVNDIWHHTWCPVSVIRPRSSKIIYCEKYFKGFLIKM